MMTDSTQENDDSHSSFGEPLTEAQSVGLLLKMYSDNDPAFADKADKIYRDLEANGLSWDEIMLAMKTMAEERHEAEMKNSISSTPEEFFKLLDDFGNDNG